VDRERTPASTGGRDENVWFHSTLKVRKKWRETSKDLKRRELLRSRRGRRLTREKRGASPAGGGGQPPFGGGKRKNSAQGSSLFTIGGGNVNHDGKGM